MLDECSAVAAATGYAPRAAYLERIRGMLTAEGSQMTASMFRDIKAGAPVEADHVIGDLVARADAAKVPVPKLRTAYTHLKAYEKARGVNYPHVIPAKAGTTATNAPDNAPAPRSLPR